MVLRLLDELCIYETGVGKLLCRPYGAENSGRITPVVDTTGYYMPLLRS